MQAAGPRTDTGAMKALDLQTSLTLVAVAASGYLMVVAGLAKRQLRWRAPLCPRCGDRHRGVCRTDV